MPEADFPNNRSSSNVPHRITVMASNGEKTEKIKDKDDEGNSLLFEFF